MADDRQRRRRRPRSAAAGLVDQAPATTPKPAADAGAKSAPKAAGPRADPAARRRAQRDPAERGLRDLVGSGRSILGVEGALRGRDVNRPTEEDLAEAEREIVVVRRHWTPDGRR